MTSTQEAPQTVPSEKTQAQQGQRAQPVEHVHGSHCNHPHHHALAPIVRTTPKLGRNDPCSCGSNKKYKKCCGS